MMPPEKDKGWFSPKIDDAASAREVAQAGAVMTDTQTASSQRLGWVDSAKGIGIVLVVIGHALRGLEAAGLVDDQVLYRIVDTAIYAFHMPFFFFLSGLLIERTLLAATPGDYILSRLQRLIWPLVLWTWIFFLFRGLAGGLANSPVDWATFPIIPLPPQDHFWFLWALFVMQLLLLPARPILQSSSNRVQVWSLLWLGSVLLYLSGPPLGPMAVWLGSAMANAPFFLLGAATMGVRYWRPSIWIGGLSFLGFILAIWSVFWLPNAPLWLLVIGSSATLLLCVTMMALEQPILSRPAFRWIAGLGRASLSIYVAHTIFSAAARIALQQAGITDFAVHMAVGTVVGLLCPAVLYITARRMGWAGKLGF